MSRIGIGRSYEWLGIGQSLLTGCYIISGVFRGAIGPWPPFGQKNFFFTIGKIWKTWFGPLCVSTSGQRKFLAPLFEILNTPLLYIMLKYGIHSTRPSVSVTIQSSNYIPAIQQMATLFLAICATRDSTSDVLYNSADGDIVPLDIILPA